MESNDELVREAVISAKISMRKNGLLTESDNYLTGLFNGESSNYMSIFWCKLCLGLIGRPLSS